MIGGLSWRGGRLAGAGGGGWRRRQGVGALSPRIAVDVEGVTILGEAIDERDDASGAGKDGAPVLEREIRSNHGAGALVATTDDAVEGISGASVAGEISQLVKDQDFGSGVAFQTALHGW